MIFNCRNNVLKFPNGCQKVNINIGRKVFSRILKGSKVSSNDEKNCDPLSEALVWSEACVLVPLEALEALKNFCDKSSKPLPLVVSLLITKLILRFDCLKVCGDIESNPGPGVGDSHGHVPDHHGRDDHNGPATGRSALQVGTYNVRGLGDKKKVRHLVNACHKLSNQAVDSIFMFQETFVENLGLLDYIWRGEYHLTPGTGQSLGCLTLLSSPFKILERHNIEARGHVLVVTKNNMNQAELIIANIYAPNGLSNDKIDFFESVILKVLDLRAIHNCDVSIVAGDFNLVFNEDEVKYRSLPNNEKNLATSVSSMFNAADLTDGWTVTDKKAFTWTTSRYGKQIFSTLDRIWFSGPKLTLKTKDVDWSLSLSDHAMVTATFDNVPPNCNRRNFISRLDPRMLDDQEARQILDDEFRTLMDSAAPDWNPHVALEYCKMSIRTAVFTTTGKIKARYRNEEKELNENINNIINELSRLNEASPNYLLMIHKLDDLRGLKRQLVEKIGSKIEQRNARTWHNEGELSNKYFFNLLNRRTNDEIKSLRINDQMCDEAPKIEAAIRSFYKELYEMNGESLVSNEDFFRNITPVDEAEAINATRALTLGEIEETLKSCADSSPGPDGIPYSYLRYFWTTIGPILIKAWDYSLLVNELPPSHKTSYLRLIPKAGKDSSIISNLRPITLSNTDHKLITKTYARKLTAIVGKQICQEQTAYLPNRLINDNIRSMLMTMDLANIDSAVDGVIVSLDAKKAFDSVDHNYIRNILKAFGLGCFIPIFNVLYKGLKSDIILNGGTIDGYRILRGVKQGDALSCIIFIMFMVLLLKNFKCNPEIVGIKSKTLDVDIPKVFGYADDVNAVIKTDVGGIQSLFNEYETFSHQSGLILNADKTEILRFKKTNLTNRSFNVTYMGKDYNLTTSQGIKINGILFFQDQKVREEKNVEKVVAAMSKHLTRWSRRHLTLLGKILILKTFAISQAVFLMQSMSLNEKSLIKINQLMFKFLWNKNFNARKAPDRIKREIVLTPCRLGGFGMADIFKMHESFNLRAIGRMARSEHPILKQIWINIKASGFFEAKTSYAVDLKVKEGLKLLNKKRIEVLSWPEDKIVSNACLLSMLRETKLVSVLTHAGKLSIPAHRVLHRRPQLKLHEVNAAELRSIERYLIDQRLLGIIRGLNTLPPVDLNTIESSEIYPTKPGTVVSIATLNSKVIRESLIADDEALICVYRSGIILTPGEVLSWTKNIKRLTSTRHKCALLRIAHGDVYTNSRLFKFGLIGNPNCANCDVTSEDLEHRLVGCPAARLAWRTMEGYIGSLNMPTQEMQSLEAVLGADGNRQSKLALTLRTELATRLMSRGGQVYCPAGLTNASVKTVLMVERISEAQRTVLSSAIND